MVVMFVLEFVFVLLNWFQDILGGVVVVFEFMFCSFIKGYLVLKFDVWELFDVLYLVNLLVELVVMYLGGLDVVLEGVLVEWMEVGEVLDVVIVQNEVQWCEMWVWCEVVVEIVFVCYLVLDIDIVVFIDRVVDYLCWIEFCLCVIDVGCEVLLVVYLGDGNIYYICWFLWDDVVLKVGL